MYAHFKKAPGNKKLGVLYVVDSVTRQWIEQARKLGQTLGPSASDGTFAAGVNHVTELLPALMQDILSVAPEDQKVRSLGTFLPLDTIKIVDLKLKRKVRWKCFSLQNCKDLKSTLRLRTKLRIVCCNQNSLLCAILGQDQKTNRNLGAR